ncbi:MAG: hypothetical protein MRK01_12425 [Candidatus Scalindua sp.]|nr:hypothetical protein [Candidatus Scalindua sp.]
MASFKHFILFSVMVLFITLFSLGCGSQGTTTIFKWTPVGSMKDSVTVPEELSSELEVQKEREDTKRMKRLQENAKKESFKQKTPTKSVTEETAEEAKEELPGETIDSKAVIKP